MLLNKSPLPIPNAITIRQMTLNNVPFVPNNEPLLEALDKFQEGRSHVTIISQFSIDRAKSVKQSLVQCIHQMGGMSDNSGSSSESGGGGGGWVGWDCGRQAQAPEGHIFGRFNGSG